MQPNEGKDIREPLKLESLRTVSFPGPKQLGDFSIVRIHFTVDTSGNKHIQEAEKQWGCVQQGPQNTRFWNDDYMLVHGMQLIAKNDRDQWHDDTGEFTHDELEQKLKEHVFSEKLFAGNQIYRCSVNGKYSYSAYVSSVY